MMGQFLKTSTDKGKMVRFHFWLLAVQHGQKPKKATGRKWNTLRWWYLQDWAQLIWHLYAPHTILSVQDTLQTPPRHLPDTLQTPQNIPHFDQWWQLGETEKANEDESDWMFINCLQIISPQAVSRVTQTTPRHIPDTCMKPCKY